MPYMVPQSLTYSGDAMDMHGVNRIWHGEDDNEGEYDTSSSRLIATRHRFKGYGLSTYNCVVMAVMPTSVELSSWRDTIISHQLGLRVYLCTIRPDDMSVY
jgi:hypothetical protein